MIMLAGFFPQPIIWILGPKYGHLQFELILTVLSAALSVVAGHIWSLNASRGWIPKPWKYIPLLVGLQVLLMYWVGMTTVKEVLWVNIGVGAMGFLIHGTVSLFHIFPNASRLNYSNK